MTNMQEARERLIALANLIERPPHDDVLLEKSVALTAAGDIRILTAPQALARRDGVEEPVAWRWKQRLPGSRFKEEVWRVTNSNDTADNLREAGVKLEPLYAHPASTAPGAFGGHSSLDEWLDAIEAVHGVARSGPEGQTINHLSRRETKALILAALRQPDTAGDRAHASDCAVHKEPAYPAEPCDCTRRVHPDLTAFRAVDACGGTFTPKQEASGYAQGYRDALAAASRAVKVSDALTEELLAALHKCGALFSEIRGDWTDPRAECREGWEIIAAATAKATEVSQ